MEEKIRQQARKKMPKLTLPHFPQFDYHTWPVTPDIEIESTESEYFESKGEIKITQDEYHTKVYLPKVLAKQGLKIFSLADAYQKAPKLLQAHLTTVVGIDEDKLSAYHYANLSQGLVIYVPEKMQLKQPIILTIDAKAKNLIHHLLLVAARQSNVQILQHTTSNKSTQYVNLMVEVVAQEDSHVLFTILDEPAENTLFVFNRRTKLGNHARVDWAAGMLGDSNILGDLDSELIGEGSKADSKLIALTSGNQQVVVNNRVTNRGRRTKGLISQRGVVLDHSQLVFNGIGDIIHGAHGANAEQENRLLIMGKHARGDANPILLIDENDVEAGHAASVGQVDQNQLYYLLSRGIPKKVAKRMVITGFLSAVLTKMPTKHARDKMVEVLERKLPDA